jgi:8-oxo-dGTP pyrophosphatase MutT (NUDIX family)
MIFTNRENEKVDLEDGRTVWLSRSVAVVVHVWMKVDGVFYLLTGKRGPGCPDEVGRWNLPCGYLDWDEDLQQACQREVWEETGVKLADYLYQGKGKILVDAYSDVPWLVTSSITADNSKKQNVSHHYGLVIEADELPPLSSENCEPGEISDLKWATKEEITELDFCFNHDTRISDFASKFQLFKLGL